MYKIKCFPPVNLSYVNLTTRTAKEPSGEEGKKNFSAPTPPKCHHHFLEVAIGPLSIDRRIQGLQKCKHLNLNVIGTSNTVTAKARFGLGPTHTQESHQLADTCHGESKGALIQRFNTKAKGGVHSRKLGQAITGKAHSHFQIFHKNKETRQCLLKKFETKKNVWSGSMDNPTDKKKNTALGVGTVTFWGSRCLFTWFDTYFLF